jgi:hypothetical protein
MQSWLMQSCLLWNGQTTERSGRAVATQGGGLGPPPAAEPPGRNGIVGLRRRIGPRNGHRFLDRVEHSVIRLGSH